MSSSAVLASVSRALRTLLFEGIQANASLHPYVATESAIVFLNPTDTAKDSANRLSVWLYQITENEFAKNQSPVRVGNGRALAQPPLALNLHFLITPFIDNAETNLLLLGQGMQVLYDNAIVVLRDTNEGVFEELRITICRLTLEELTRIWEALIEPYKLSVCYEVRVMHIESNNVVDGARVVDVTQNMADVPEEATAR